MLITRLENTRLKNIHLIYRPTERTYQAVRTRLKNIRLENARLQKNPFDIPAYVSINR